MRDGFVIVVPALRVEGMALFPFILVKHESLKYDEILLRHERIHLRQELELLVIPFYMMYLLHYLYNLLRYLDSGKAYLNIVFEKEAYAKEAETDYLQRRKFWAWLNFC
ncbi:hypothetical protein [Mucilaginibacter paludis]|uniref:Peptidase M56 domain-containing protein n=1 Tax=Mucilaginibacter paludis DSM 18603 TaxID=714943 RepID=H1YG46_9SPHI|nr:hypothetical protein [Mucilaginibacter paludis]EHQ27310.1 hypothetical protein Mucpa_3206 [Mucilaginibacter paludis DSM 18603]